MLQASIKCIPSKQQKKLSSLCIQQGSPAFNQAVHHNCSHHRREWALSSVEWRQPKYPCSKTKYLHLGYANTHGSHVCSHMIASSNQMPIFTALYKCTCKLEDYIGERLKINWCVEHKDINKYTWECRGHGLRTIIGCFAVRKDIRPTVAGSRDYEELMQEVIVIITWFTSRQT